MALQISEADVTRALSPLDALTAVSQAHKDLAAGKVDNVVRTRARTAGLSLHALSAASAELGFAASKVYSATAKTARSTILLYSVLDGELLAVIEANELGRLRTAAASAMATAFLWSKKINCLGIIGAGYQAEGIVRAYSDKKYSFRPERIVVYSRTTDKRENFASTMSRIYGLPVDSCADADSCLRVSNVLVTVTNSSKPLFSDEAGAEKKLGHISALGSNSLARREIPARTLGQACITVDSIEVAKKECGNLLPLIENGKLLWSQVKEIGNLLVENNVAQTAQGLSVYLSHGLAVQDLYLAAELYKRISNR